MDVHMQVFMLTYCSFLSGIYLGVAFLGYVAIRCTTYGGTAKQFSKVASAFHRPTSHV